MQKTNTLTLGSFFDGIGGSLLAAHHAGITPLWASEIEAFPCSVTKKHFPAVKHLGDITKINPDELEPADIICAGSPCQDLSIAGKRKGLEGERSGLFKAAISIFHRLRERTGRPRFFVWENVPGAFSSNKGMDFRTVLEEIGQTEISIPPHGKWAPAGMAELPQCQIAWRTLDAQYWGVPQRRRRIFLVADFAAHGRRAGEILFERESVSGNPQESKGAGKGTARGTERSARTPDTGIVAAGFIGKAAPTAGSIGYEKEQAPTLLAGKQQHVAIYDMTHASEVMRRVKDGIVPTLNARMGTGGNQVPVAHIYGTKSYSEYERGKTATLRASGGAYGGGSENLVLSHTIVRRLTPTECERLQGLPDGYTEGGSDTARYKALGNGMAQPCIDYVIKRIKAHA